MIFQRFIEAMLNEPWTAFATRTKTHLLVIWIGAISQ